MFLTLTLRLSNRLNVLNQSFRAKPLLNWNHWNYWNH